MVEAVLSNFNVGRPRRSSAISGEGETCYWRIYFWERIQEESLRRLFGFVGRFCVGLGGNNGGSYNHSDKGECNHEIVHGVFSLCGSTELATT